MIWVLIAYLTGFAGTLIAVSAMSQMAVGHEDRGGFVRTGTHWDLPPGRCIIAAMLWFLTLPLGAYLAIRVSGETPDG